MSRSEDDLKKAFDQAIWAFNGAKEAKNYFGLFQYLAADIVMKRVKGNESITGNYKVIEYLNCTQIGKWPMVKYDDIQAMVDGDYGAITCAKGTYTDASGTLKVQVAFCFEYDAAHDQWLVANANCTPTKQ
jgi:hypothetical protein